MSRFLTFTKFKFVNSVVVFLIEYNHVFAHSVLVQLRVPLKTTQIGLVEKAIFVIACIQKNPSFFHIIQCQAYPFVLILSTQKHDKKNFFFVLQHRANNKKNTHNMYIHFFEKVTHTTCMKKFLCTTLAIICIFCIGFGFAPTLQSFCVEQSISLPILMYHSILNSKTGTYIVSKYQLEQDIIALQQNGYTTVFPSQVIDYVYNKKPLPSKPIMITFDDGYYNNLYYGLEVLKKYNAKANINVIAKISDNFSVKDDSNPNYSHLTWGQIKQISDSGCFEIGNHTFDMHKFSPRYGIGQRCCETDEEYTKNLNDDIDLFENALKKNTGLETNVFAYPFGKYNNLSKQILSRRGYKLILTCEERANKITTGDAECLLNLGRINRSGSLSTATVIEKVIHCT